MQKFGVDFLETYSSVAKMNSLRAVMAVMVAKRYVREQPDKGIAFLNSYLKDEVYMEVPKGIPNAEKNVQAGQVDIGSQAGCKCLKQNN